MNRKQILVKGFEIGLQCKDVVSGQIALANEMMLIEEHVQFGCTNCVYAGSTCNYSMTNNGNAPMYTGENVGFGFVIKSCTGFKQK